MPSRSESRPRPQMIGGGVVRSTFKGAQRTVPPVHQSLACHLLLLLVSNFRPALCDERPRPWSHVIEAPDGGTELRGTINSHINDYGKVALRQSLRRYESLTVADSERQVRSSSSAGTTAKQQTSKACGVESKKPRVPGAFRVGRSVACSNCIEIDNSVSPPR